mgnify:CR=1 FL=1
MNHPSFRIILKDLPRTFSRHAVFALEPVDDPALRDATVLLSPAHATLADVLVAYAKFDPEGTRRKLKTKHTPGDILLELNHQFQNLTMANLKVLTNCMLYFNLLITNLTQYIHILVDFLFAQCRTARA